MSGIQRGGVYAHHYLSTEEREVLDVRPRYNVSVRYYLGWCLVVAPGLLLCVLSIVRWPWVWVVVCVYLSPDPWFR